MVKYVNLKLILQSFVVGIGKIIPGVSGSMLAMTLGIYDEFLESLTNFFNNISRHFKFLLNFGIGIILAIIFFSRIISFLLNNFYYITMYIFLGLIIGSLLSFSRKIKFRKNDFLMIGLIIILMIIISNYKWTSNFEFNGNILGYIFIMILGFIDALSSIIPGISGTTLFMILGSYSFVLKILSNPFNIEGFFYGIGLAIGIILVSYLMNYLLKNYKEKTNKVVFAFMTSSLIILGINLIEGITLINVIIFLLSLLVSYILNK